MKVSVIIPVIRKSSAQRTVESLPMGLEIIAERDTNHVGCIKMIHRLVKKTSNDIIVFIGDDCVAHPEMITSGLQKLETFPNMAGIVGLKTYPGNQIAHWIFNKKILQFFRDDYLLSPAYHHCYSDTELYLTAKRLGLWGCTDNIVIDHYHPINGYEWDDGYDRAYTGWIQKDAEVLYNRTGVKSNMDFSNSSITQPDVMVRCNEHSKCFHTCHHSKPHLPEKVTIIGSRYNSFEIDISCCPTVACTERGLCDMGFQVCCR